MVENFDRPGDGGIIEQFPGAAMQRMGQTKVKPDGTVTRQRNLATGRDQMFRLSLVNRQLRQLGGAGGGIEGGDVEEHFGL